MKLEQIEQVVEIAKTGSINQAAYNLFLSQPSLSLSIKKLEEEMGGELFVRSTKGVKLTALGKDFVSYANAILMQVAQLNQLGISVQQKLGLRFSVANIGFRFVSDACAKLYQNHNREGIRLEIFDCIGMSVLDLVAEQTAEVGMFRMWSYNKKFTQNQLAARSIQYFPLAFSAVSIVVGQGNPLFRNPSDTIKREQLADYTLITYPYMDSGPHANVIGELGLPASRNQIIASTRAALYEMLARTDCYYVGATPRSAYTHTDYYPQARSLILEDCKLSCEIGWIKSDGNHLSPLANEFIRTLGRYFIE